MRYLLNVNKYNHPSIIRKKIPRNFFDAEIFDCRFLQSLTIKYMIVIYLKVFLRGTYEVGVFV